MSLRAFAALDFAAPPAMSMAQGGRDATPSPVAASQHGSDARVDAKTNLAAAHAAHARALGALLGHAACTQQVADGKKTR
jgi:hypothetical protein